MWPRSVHTAGRGPDLQREPDLTGVTGVTVVTGVAGRGSDLQNSSFGFQRRRLKKNAA